MAVRWCLVPIHGRVMPDTVRLALGVYLAAGLLAVIVGAPKQSDTYFVERDAVLSAYAVTVPIIVLVVRDTATLGRLVGARRPSVTTALGGLGQAGLVERQNGGFLLHGDVEGAMRRVAGEPDAQPGYVG